ncbi:hypothetical protein BMR05_13075 [Methylococcaceae bacterium HT4]|nr:hypothetical protein BMR05_13075 [Methylococcaceae bacterium HT4]
MIIMIADNVGKGGFMRQNRSEAKLRKNVVPLYSEYCKPYSALSEKYRVYAQYPILTHIRFFCDRTITNHSTPQVV